MRILIVGSDKIYSIENYYVKYFSAAGWRVSKFLAPNMFYDYYQTSLFNRLAFRASISPIYKQINDRFKQTVEDEKPDLIWVFKGMEILPESLAWVQRKKIRLVNYNPDNPFLFSGRGSGNKNISNAIGLYDLHFTYNLEVKQKLEIEFKTSTYFLPFGFEIDEALYDHCKMLPEIIEPCFLGNPDSFRSIFITKLADAGITINVFGHDWRKFINHPRVKVQDAVYGINQWEVLRRYRIQLNLMRPHNLNSHNMRTFEVPAIGGIMLAPDTPEHRSFFRHTEEIFLFTEFDNCLQEIEVILKMSQQQVDEIRNAARRRSITSGYSYQARAMEVMTKLNQLIKG